MASWRTALTAGLALALVAACSALAVQDYRHRLAVEREREAAAASERQALRDAGWATPKEVSSLEDAIASGRGAFEDVQGLLAGARERYRRALGRVDEERAARAEAEGELLRARQALDLWGETVLPSTEWGAPEPDPGSSCPCPSLWDTDLTPRAIAAEIRSQAGVRALTGRIDIYGRAPGWDERRKISAHPLDLDVTGIWQDREVERLDCPPPPDWFAGAGLALGSEGLGLAGTVVGPGWEPKVWRWSPRVRPWATAGASSDSWVLMTGVGGSW